MMINNLMLIAAEKFSREGAAVLSAEPQPGPWKDFRLPSIRIE
jgi:hypothetical protein